MTQPSLLMVLPMPPYPARASGISIRYFPIIQALSERYCIDLFFFIEPDSPTESLQTIVGQLGKYCRRVETIARDRQQVGLGKKLWVRALSLCPNTPAHAFYCYDAQAIAQSLWQRLQQQSYATCIWVSARYGHILQALQRLQQASEQRIFKRLLMDICDCKYLSKAREPRDSIIYALDLWKTKRWEAQLINQADEAIYISPLDAQEIPQTLLKQANRRVIPNGIYTPGYSNKQQPGISSPSIGFLGNMGYAPNIHACRFILEQLYPQLKINFPELRFYIIGRQPSEEVLAYRTLEGVEITGDLESIWPHVNGVDLFLLPIFQGSGLQNKILEVMYAGRPCIISPGANAAINAKAGRDLLICEGPEAWLEASTALLKDSERRAQLGAAGKKFIESQFTWPEIIKHYQRLIDG